MDTKLIFDDNSQCITWASKSSGGGGEKLHVMEQHPMYFISWEQRLAVEMRRGL